MAEYIKYKTFLM